MGKPDGKHPSGRKDGSARNAAKDKAKLEKVLRSELKAEAERHDRAKGNGGKK